MPSVFLVSDTHFGHTGVCRFTRNDGVTKLRPWDSPLEWAKKHCPSYITNDVHRNTGEPGKSVQIDYYFGNERDAMWFTLRWSP